VIIAPPDRAPYRFITREEFLEARERQVQQRIDQLPQFRDRAKALATLEGELENDRLGQRMFEIASSMPGYVSYKDFSASDGENVSIVEFDSLEALADWRDHPEHKVVQERGRQGESRFGS
jgi:heme-degrading monooxygenase HmoA